MQNLMSFNEFYPLDQSHPDAKCYNCKRMHCQLRRVFDSVLCRDCFQKQLENNPKLFLKEKTQPTMIQQPVEQASFVKTANKPIGSDQININGFALFGAIFLGVLVVSGIILGIIFALDINGLLF